MPLRDGTGNPEAREGLLRALAAGRLPHALLFHGPPGVGRRDAALALAQALLCPQASPDACGQCNTCRRVALGLHPDVRSIERDGLYVKVEAVRELVRESFLRPYEGRAKVFVIPEAERLNDDSANTLLKTLEEPPASTYLVLVTNSREAVLPTVRSRCQAISFHVLSRADLVRRLVEHHGFDRPEAETRARLALGDAARAVEVDLAALRGQRDAALALMQPLARGELGPAEAEGIAALAEAVSRRDGLLESFLFETVRPLARDAMLLAAAAASDLLVHAEAAEALAALGRRMGVAGAAALLADLDEAEADLRVSANRKLLLEAVLAGVYERAVTAGR